MVLVLGGAVKYYRSENSQLITDKAALTAQLTQVTDMNNVQVANFKDQISKQNATIDRYVALTTKQTLEMQNITDNLRKLHESSELAIIELRKQDTSKFSCEQSIDFLVAKAPTLDWKARP